MDLYTFIMAFRGGTYISQVYADNVKSACFEWAKQLTVNDIKYFGPTAKRELINSRGRRVFPGTHYRGNKCVVLLCWTKGWFYRSKYYKNDFLKTCYLYPLRNAVSNTNAVTAIVIRDA